ncbi:Histidinol phosphate phosphatase, HisJ [Syntrophomonas zehnderi OL-4]|uniref:Histidinol-phosphatase n=1 Tax=Syntrophomonas zehnderi OL-4 TaxID=690567 RepID=A0A0E4C9P5_9FIRM|nr:histidinol-phosphatase HisJ family protein [Syntrophomonas zehnderi]CFY06444.1 Histidinol phosphate phosphatase, HisJ [Syntrophomonas zehnderi OL-4]
MLVDYHVHALAHGEYTYSKEWLNSFIDQALGKGIREMGFSEHDELISKVDLHTYEAVKIQRLREINLRLGIEVDYIPGQESRLKELVNGFEYDYTIGSVHFLDGWAFDHPDYRYEYSQRDIDAVYARYTEVLIDMIQSGLFDIVGHLDLVKIWGDRPRRKKSASYMQPVLNVIHQANMAVEINSAGLRKPVGELYPAFDLLKMMFARNIPITFGSDAHHPEQMGEGLKEAYVSAWSAGYRYMVTFIRHHKTLTPIQF